MLKKKRLNELSYEILDSILIVAIMASCATSVHQPPEWEVYTDWDGIQFQECALDKNHCIIM